MQLSIYTFRNGFSASRKTNRGPLSLTGPSQPPRQLETTGSSSAPALPANR